MDPSKWFFPESYAESRAWFREQLGAIRQIYPDAVLHNQALDHDPDLTTDWIESHAEVEYCLILSTALHGVEGFTGTAVLHRFLEAFLPRIDPNKTALLLIHALNPWGMQHRRQRNVHNIELNRNFRFEGEEEKVICNSGYRDMRDFLHPMRPLGHYFIESLRYYLGITYRILKHGVAAVREASLLGQLDDPKGPYYGGRELQPEGRLALDLVTGIIRRYKHVVHLDMHTGYGPASDMSLVNSALEGTAPRVWKERFDYPRIVRADPEAFYPIEGDWTDALYRYAQQHAPGHTYFGTAFEFGTMGDGTLQQMRGLRALIFENQLSQFGTTSEATRARVVREYRELFDPPADPYRSAVIHSTDRAFEGILTWFGLIKGDADPIGGVQSGGGAFYG